MKKINRRLLFIAFAGICCAYVNKKTAWQAPRDFHHYAFYQKNADGTKYYVSQDLTAAGWVKGNQYDCVTPTYICTIIAQPVKLHTDFFGMWFSIADVPQPGVDSSGVFLPVY